MPDQDALGGDPEELREEILASDEIYRGRVLRLRRDTVRLPDGHETVRDVVEHPASVVILPIDTEGQITFVRQWRVPAGRALLELPAGGLNPGEEPAAAAARELQEEADLAPGELTPLTEFYVAPGWATEYMHAFVARGCTPSSLPADADERLRVERYTLGEAFGLIDEGEIQDAKTILALHAIAIQAVGALGKKVIRFYQGD